MPSKTLSLRIHVIWTSQRCMSVKKIKYSLLDCLGLKIHSKLLMLCLKFYYRSCLTRQIFSVIYIFPVFTELIALHLSSWDCLFKSFFYILSHYSTPGTSYKLLPLLIFYSKKQLENLLRRGEGERRRKQDTDFCPGLLLYWDLIFFLAPLKTFPKSCFPHLVMMCTSAEGRSPVLAKGEHWLWAPQIHGSWIHIQTQWEG